MNEIEISLFPIPGSVSLPFSKTSLHVFEPRYRKMIKDSIEAKRRIGVAHTQKVIAEGKSRPGAPLEEILSTNQKTYLAHPVFSAGFAKIKQTLPDGRMLIEILMDARYEIKQELQQVPYKVVLCEPYEDEDTIVDAKLRQQMDQILLSLVPTEAEDLTAFFKSEEWQNLTFLEYSFKVYSFVDCAPDILQKVLELKSSVSRVNFLKDILTREVIH